MSYPSLFERIIRELNEMRRVKPVCSDSLRQSTRHKKAKSLIRRLMVIVIVSMLASLSVAKIQQEPLEYKKLKAALYSAAMGSREVAKLGVQNAFSLPIASFNAFF